MGVLQRFERRLEGLVEGAFARAFGGVVQPVEVAAALQREAGDKRAVVSPGRVLVPNDYTVELSPYDAERLSEYDQPLRAELADMLTEHARDQGWSFVGPVVIHMEALDDLATGVFRIRSTVLAAIAIAPAPDPFQARADAAVGPVAPVRAGHGRPHLEMVAGSDPGHIVNLTPPSLVIGRGDDAGLRLTDTGVSRRHAELQVGDEVTIVDLRSTNGTLVNGRRVDVATLEDGDRISVGTSVLIFRTGS